MHMRATLFMRAAVLIIGFVVLLFAAMLFPSIAKNAALVANMASYSISPLFSSVNIAFLMGLYGSVAPFFIALYQAMRLLSYIDKKSAFSDISVKALKRIYYCAIAIFALYMLGIMPFVYCAAEIEDAPGLLLIGFAVGLAPFIVALFAAILERLLKEAIAMKAENDLTI